MNRVIWLFSLILITSVFTSGAGAANTAYVREATVCPADGGTMESIDFANTNCSVSPIWEIDPQGREIWVRALIDIDDGLISSERPLGLFISAKASSEAYLNGVRIGANGQPAVDATDETPGRMDAVLYIPRESVLPGENEIILRMSAQRGFINFRYPVHWLAIGEYGSPTAFLLNAYWPSLIPLGALILGAIYFSTTALTGQARLNTALLILISLFAAAQVFVEVYRGLTPYLYPAHEWRMILIVLFSCAFALCLLAYIFSKYLRHRTAFAAAALITLAPLLVFPSFDGKAGFSILFAAIIGAIVSAFAVTKNKPQAYLHLFIFVILGASIMIFQGQFLNVIFFYEVTALLLALFVAEAISAAKERKLLENERARSHQLELSLERASHKNANKQISVSSAGKLDFVQVDEIAHCKGAGDYVEISMRDGREILHNGSLAQLEEQLPAVFLRVHRSYLVNTNFVKTLRRENNGVGILQLTTETEIPVSRRIMPKVRSALQ
ncbi:MAG: hypothetical protein HKN14_15195 [Marinicaulis sp.]|nr:hypothetical protein [Marinicaulis sp.]